MRLLILALSIVLVSSMAGSPFMPDRPLPGSPMTTGNLVVETAQLTPVQRNFTIYVGITGFNSTYQNGLMLTVNQGDLVSITFLYNDTGPNNPHNILIQAYGLTTGTLDQTTRTRVLSFTANIAGPTAFVCIDSNCAGHANLQAGLLDVKPFAGSPWIKTTLHLNGEVETHSLPKISLTAHMIDVNGSVISGALVRFYRNSTWGFAEIGAVATNNSGLASLTYAPPGAADIMFKAIFAGSGAYLPSDSAPLTIYYSSPRDPWNGFPFVWGQNPLVDLRIVGVSALTGLFWIGVVFAVVSSVWATYLFVFRQVVGIWREGHEGVLHSPGLENRTVDQDKSTAPVLRRVSYPVALLVGLGMMALGYGSFLLLNLLVPGMALLLLPALSLVETVGVSRLLLLSRRI